MKVFSTTLLLPVAGGLWLTVVGVSTASLTAEEVDGLFQHFIQDHGKRYSSQEEHERRHHIFHQHLLEIERHNQGNSGSNYTLGITPFTDLLPHELPFGYDKSHHPAYSAAAGPLSTSSPLFSAKERYLRLRPLQSNFNDHFDDVNPSNLPKSVDWRVHQPPVVTPVKNQGGCGSCWAFAATACLESHIALQTGKMFVLSVQELVSCVPNPHHCGGAGGCAGSTVELAYDFVSQQGMVEEWAFGYQSGHGQKVNCTIMDNKFDDQEMTTRQGGDLSSGHTINGAVASVVGFSNLPTNSYHNLMQAVATMGPVAVTVAASSWGLYKGGIFDDDKDEHRTLNHAVVLEGYGTDEETGQDYWLVRNSWSPMWGENGYIRLKRVDPTTLKDPSKDCKTDVQPADGIACTKDNNGHDIVPPKVTVCGTSGILFDAVVPIGGHLLK